MRHEALYGDRVVRCFSPRPASLHAMWADAVQRSGGAEALVCDGRRWSYAQADAVLRRMAAVLAAQGIVRGDRVAMFIGNRPEFVFVLFALQRLGAIAVPIGVREQKPGLQFMLQQCTAKGIVFDDALADRVPGTAEVPSLALRVSVEALAQDADADADADAPVAQVAEQDTAVILYTSGTTGRPKGAMLTHIGIAHSVLHYRACMRLTAADRSALAVPASHVTGLIASIATMVLVGGATVIVPVFKAGPFIALMAAERITHTLMVPAMYQLCLLAPDFGAQDLRHWRSGGYGGAPMPVATIDALAQRLPGLLLLNAYGATETTSPATLMPAGLTRDHADTVGVPLPCADLRVMDAQGRELPAGAVGELWITGPMLVPGYWDDPAATAAAFTGGYWHSGDLGSVDASGFVRILDRKKDMLSRGGYKVYSVEVENTLMAMPGVIEAAVVGRPCPVLGERVHAFIHSLTLAQDDAAVRRFCAAALADYKVPETITWCDVPLPRNANGKLLKRALPERLDGGT